MASWLVLGLGNPLSGADAFGPAVVDRLRGASPLTGVAVHDAGTDLLTWVPRFAEYDHIVLVDAVAVDNAGDAPACPPCVSTVAEPVFSGWDASSPGVHEISPLVSVRLFRALQCANGTVDVPSIQLVALFVTAAGFTEPPGDAEVIAGVAAVQNLVAPAFARRFETIPSRRDAV